MADVNEFFNDLDAGVFSEKLSKAISEVALGVLDNNAPGKITITLDIKRIGSSHQVAVKHGLVYKRPTRKGHVLEHNVTETPMHVGKSGALSLFPENQVQMFDRKGGVVEKGSQ